MTIRLILYGDYLSQCVRRVAILLRQFDLHYEFVFLNLLNKENRVSLSYPQLNPNMTVPTLLDVSDDVLALVKGNEHLIGEFSMEHSRGGFVVYERYICEKYLPSNHTIYDSGNLLRKSLINQWLDWTQSTIRPAISAFVRASYFYPMVSNSPVDVQAVTAANEKILTSLDTLEKHLTAQSTHDNTKDTIFLVGNIVSVADLSLCCEISQLLVVGYNPVQKYSSKYALTHKWISSVTSAFSHYNDEDINQRAIETLSQVEKLGLAFK